MRLRCASLVVAAVVTVLAGCPNQSGSSAPAPTRVHVGNLVEVGGVPGTVQLVHSGRQDSLVAFWWDGRVVVAVPPLPEGDATVTIADAAGKPLRELSITTAAPTGTPGAQTLAFVEQASQLVQLPASADPELAALHAKAAADFAKSAADLRAWVAAAQTGTVVLGTGPHGDVTLDANGLRLMDAMVAGAGEDVVLLNPCGGVQSQPLTGGPKAVVQVAVGVGLAIAGGAAMAVGTAVFVAGGAVIIAAGVAHAGTGLNTLDGIISARGQEEIDRAIDPQGEPAADEPPKESSKLVELARRAWNGAKDAGKKAAEQLQQLVYKGPAADDAASAAENTASAVSLVDKHQLGTSPDPTPAGSDVASDPGGPASGSGAVEADLPPNDGPPTCAAGKVACGLVCTDLETDPLACGRCGHSCLGASCSRGVCQYRVIASGFGKPRGISVDDRFVYVLDVADGTVTSIDKSSGARRTLATGFGPTSGFAAVDAPLKMATLGTSVYWTIDDRHGNGHPDPYRVFGVERRHSCSGASCVASVNTHGIGGPALATDAHWGFGEWPGGLFRAFLPVSGGSAFEDEAIYGDGSEAYALATDGTFVYAIEAPGVLNRFPIEPAGFEGNPPSSTLTHSSVSGFLYTTVSLAADGVNVYWITADAKIVEYTPRDPGSPGIQIIGGTAISALTADADGAYWTDSGAGRVIRFDRASGEDTEIAVGQSKPTGIASDGRSIFWITDDGKVRMVAK